MEDLENNNCIILDPSWNIYEYADQTVMTLLDLDHFWIKQAKLSLKGTIVQL